MKKLKLGIIGSSEGNGHPYSWSAIFNGYDPLVMADCPFPIIPEYLARQAFPEAAINHAAVTHIWTQDLHTSQHIAAAAYIPHVVTHIEQMIPDIDGVLLARDDAANHVAMALPFLEAGLPIYIDKPLALTCAEVDLLFSLQKYPGQIFTCSAFQYARELEVATEEIKATAKKILHIEAYIKNAWDKYAIHLIEPIIKVIGHEGTFEKIKVIATEEKTSAHYLLNEGLTIQISTFNHGDVKPTIQFFNEEGATSVVFSDTFSAFKAALEKFVEGIREKKEITKKDFVRRCVEMLEKVNIVAKGKQTLY